MSRFARLVIQFRWPILVAWVIGAAALVVTAPFGPAFSEHGNTNPLPSSAPELRAEALLQQHFFNQPQQPQSTTFSDYVILVNAHGLSADDRTAAARIMLALRLGISSDALVQVGFPPTPSHDGQALLLPLTWDGRSAGSGQSGHRQAADIISGVQLPAGTTAGYASGSVANDEINRGIDERLPLSLALAVGAVILVLAFIFRSVLGVLAPLLSIGLGSAAGMATLTTPPSMRSGTGSRCCEASSMERPAWRTSKRRPQAGQARITASRRAPSSEPEQPGQTSR